MANSLKIGFQLSNFAEMKAMLTGLPASMQSRVLGDAVKVASRHIVTAAKQRVAVRSGALKRSLTTVVRRYPTSGKIVAVIGPDKDYYEGGKRVKKGQSRKGKDRPSNYAHLVEFGHYSAAGTGSNLRSTKGKTIRKGTLTPKSFIIAKPFLRPAVSAATPAVNADLARGVQIGMEREVKRMASKLKKFGST